MDEINLQLKGVKGWLLLMCISLTILDPSSIFLNLIIITNLTKPFFNKHPELLKMVLINGICSIGLAVFSVYAGLSLWKILPNAVTTAKKYLLAISLYSIFSIFIPTLVGLQAETIKGISGNNVLNSLLTVLYASAWYLYLKKSRRVMATYGSNL
ncbi:MAG: DUF2569 family protein [Proteobacteria bacterium]|nr:DUF2569 family protein [Pseudomonadota bacterium]